MEGMDGMEGMDRADGAEPAVPVPHVPRGTWEPGVRTDSTDSGPSGAIADNHGDPADGRAPAWSVPGDPEGSGDPRVRTDCPEWRDAGASSSALATSASVSRAPRSMPTLCRRPVIAVIPPCYAAHLKTG
nr:hypothetical protein GCM10020241_54940 [Streptoalloteichus tenebrarius]